MDKLPDEIYRKIYSYIFDVSYLRTLHKKYIGNDLYDNDDIGFRHKYEDRIILLNGQYHWINKVIYFRSILSCHWFEQGYTDINDYDYQLDI